MTVAQLTMTATTPAETALVRTTLREHLDRWQCANPYDIVLVFSELVTNAVVHAGGATTIKVEHGDQTMRFEVHDNAPWPPTPRDADQRGRGGFGLHIVTTASRSWGWEHTPTGKRVWALVPCCPDR